MLLIPSPCPTVLSSTSFTSPVWIFLGSEQTLLLFFRGACNHQSHCLTPSNVPATPPSPAHTQPMKATGTHSICELWRKNWKQCSWTCWTFLSFFFFFFFFFLFFSHVRQRISIPWTYTTGKKKQKKTSNPTTEHWTRSHDGQPGRTVTHLILHKHSEHS